MKLSTLRCLISLTARRKWKLFQVDVNNAFLHGDLQEEVYMRVSEGINCASNLVCRLRKSLYGLRQSSRKWFEKLYCELLNMDFVQSKQEYSLFIHKFDYDITILVVYVDDIIINGSIVRHIDSVK